MKEEKDKPIKSGEVPPPESRSDKSAYGNLPIEIYEEDLAQKGVQRLLLSEIQRLKSETYELKGYEERFHSIDKDKAVLETKFIKHKLVDIFSKFCLTMGGVILSLGIKSFPSTTTSGSDFSAWLLIVTGGILLIGGLLISFKN
jgi:hypothetical protein